MPAVALAHGVDQGILVLVGGLFLAAILAHRHWRARIRLEDQLEAQALDAARTLGRYQAAWRRMKAPAAFVDRVSGLVVDATPGWVAAGLPEAGEPVHGGDDAARAAWEALGPPVDGQDRPPTALALHGRVLLAHPLGGEHLGLVLVALP